MQEYLFFFCHSSVRPPLKISLFPHTRPYQKRKGRSAKPPLKISLFPITRSYQNEKGRLVGKIFFLPQRRLMNSKIWERAAAWQNQQNDLCTQRRLKSGWASTLSDQESSLSAWRNLGTSAIQWADSEDSVQTGRMSRLIWVFTGHTGSGTDKEGIWW